MKKFVCFLLMTILVLNCASVGFATLTAEYRDGKIYVTNSGTGITRLNTGDFLDQNHRTVVITPPAGATTYTITGSADPFFGGDGGTVTVTIGGGGSAPSQPTQGPANPTGAPQNPTNPPVNPTAGPSTPTNPPTTGATVYAGNYSNGTLTVSVSGITTPSAIYVDGVPTGVAIEGSGSKPVQVGNLTPGTHTVELYTWSGVVTTTFTVSGQPSGTTPTPLPTSSVHTHSWGGWSVIKNPNCEGAGEETHVCTICGQSETRRVAPLGHRYVVESENERNIIYRCTNCGKHMTKEKLIMATPTPVPAVYPTTNPSTTAQTGVLPVERNLYGHILYDSIGMLADYFAYSDAQDASTVVIEVDQDARAGRVSEIGLYMDQTLENDLRSKGYSTVRYINGKAILTISLANVNDAWFNTDEAISYRVFTTEPNAAGGVMVKVEAELATQETTRIQPSNTLTGLTLKGATDILVAQNGVYDITR